MAYRLLLLIMFILPNATAVHTIQLINIDSAIKILSPKLNKKVAAKIANSINTQIKNGNCKIPWQIILSIAFNESSFKINAVNNLTKDYGLMQISYKNIQRMSLDQHRLLTDADYSVQTACKILMFNKHRFSNNFISWVGIYRSGTALWKPNIKKNAILYNNMIYNTAYKIGFPKVIANE